MNDRKYTSKSKLTSFRKLLNSQQSRQVLFKGKANLVATLGKHCGFLWLILIT